MARPVLVEINACQWQDRRKGPIPPSLSLLAPTHNISQTLPCRHCRLTTRTVRLTHSEDVPLPPASPRSFLLDLLYEMRTPPPCRDCGDPTAKRLVASEAFLLSRCLVWITRSASRRAVDIVPVPRARVSDGGPQSCSASDSSELCLRVTCQSFRRGTSLLVIKWIASCFCSTSSLIHSLIRIGSYNFE